MTEDAMDRLEKAVNDTAKAVRSGDLACMGDLAAQTAAALSELDQNVEGGRLEAVRDLAKRNAVALEAAGRGVRAARRRLAEIIATRSGIQTYDDTGKKQKIGGPLGSMKTRL